MLSNSARDVDNVALKHDETMLMNASPVTGTPGMTQPFSLVVLLMLLSVLGSASTPVAQRTTEPLQTEWGHPDLEGVWNFSSDIPFQRPEEFGYREFLTPEEISTIQTHLSAEAAAGGRVSPDAAMAHRRLTSGLSMVTIISGTRWHRLPMQCALRKSFIRKTASCLH